MADHPQQVLDAVQRIIDEVLKPAEPAATRITVDLWQPGPWGPRVASVDWWQTDPERGEPFGAGASSMRPDPDAANVILLVETAIVTLAYMSDDRDECERVLAELRGEFGPPTVSHGVL